MAPFTERADCTACSLSYPIRDGVPVLIISEATARPIATDPEFERLVAEAVSELSPSAEDSQSLGHDATAIAEDASNPGRTDGESSAAVFDEAVARDRVTSDEATEVAQLLECLPPH